MCPMPVTGQGPPEKGQGACRCIFWAQKLMKLGYFRKQSQNLVQHVTPPQDSWAPTFIRGSESDREPAAPGGPGVCSLKGLRPLTALSCHCHSHSPGPGHGTAWLGRGAVSVLPRGWTEGCF